MKPQCPVCDAEMDAERTPWLLHCRRCGLLGSKLSEEIPDARSRAAIDEAARAEGLSALREQNFRTIVGLLGKLREQRGRLLDVGCAHGWFLREAASCGWTVVGIEPDPGIARVASRNGAEIRNGTFPDSLKPGERFDVITFNDVFEHLADLNGALRACDGALNPRGLLAINLPDARGALYRLASLLASVGLRRPLERLWQKGFPSPHLTYFTAPLLRRLAARHGFRPIYSGHLPSVAWRGLWSRLRYDRRSTVAGAALAWAATSALLPALRALPSDISLEIFEKPS